MQHSDQTESPSNRSESDLRASKYSLITNYGRRREEEEREKGERGGEREDESLRLTRVSKTRRRPMDGMGGGSRVAPLLSGHVTVRKRVEIFQSGFLVDRLDRSPR